MKKIVALFMLSVSLMFGAINLQTATKDELMSIKGIGPVKAEQIIKYRKTNKIKSADDLKNIKGFGDGVVDNVKKNKTVSSEKVKAKKEKSTKKVEDKVKAKKTETKDKALKKTKETKKSTKEKASKKTDAKVKSVKEKTAKKTKTKKEELLLKK
jgi:competence protein ComEA